MADSRSGGDDGVEGAAGGKAVEPLAAELRAVDEQIAPVGGGEDATDKLGLPLVVGGGRLVVHSEGGDERLCHIEVRERC